MKKAVMKNIEPAYSFRHELDEVHKRNRRNPALIPRENETSVDESWSIVLPDNVDYLIEYAATDLQDYFRVSMNLNLPLSREEKERCIVLDICNCPTGPTKNAPKRAFHLEVTETQIRITGSDPAGVAQGCYYLEDRMNLREAPYLERGSERCERMFSPRMVHSGWGLDQFPDSHLNAIAHAGFDSVLLFVKGPGQTTHGFMDFNNLIGRCEKFGLGVYFYSYLPSFKHPDEPDAEAFFEKNYGEVFRQSPKAKGLILVGESCVFPSKDERTTGKPRPANIGDDTRKGAVSTDQDFSVTVDSRPNPGFFPCRDYPQWLNAVKKAVRKYAPEADIVFWTYNWGNVSANERLELIRKLPLDVTLLATFEMFDSIEKYPNHRMMQPDYSITSPGPGFYFRSEAEAAKKRGLKLYSMTNTAGRTWDFGVVPYIPTPYQWFKRFRAMKKAQDDWGLSGIMDSHHYGWFPSEISECARCMETNSVPQSNPAAARVSEMVTRYVQKFDSVRLQIYRLIGASNEALRSFLNALRITLLRKGVQPQYCWQYDPAQNVHFLFLCHYECPPGCIQQIISRLWHGSVPLQTINSIPVNRYNLPDIGAWLSNSFSAIPVSPMTPFYQHTFGYSRSL